MGGNSDLTGLKVAIVHDWLLTMRGAEKCLEALCEIFPEADIFTLFHKKGAVSDSIESHRIFTSFLQSFPFVENYYHNLLPLMPLAVEQFSFDDYDVVISSSWCCAKGVVVPFDVPHICYMYTPMRFSWDLKELYAEGGGVRKCTQMGLLHWIRMWEVAAAQRPDKVLAVSEFVARRAGKAFGVECEVVYPPVDVEAFRVAGDEGREDYYLMVTSFEPNKRVDIAIDAFNALGLPLKIVGSAGRLEKRMKKMAGETVEFLGRVSDMELAELYAKAHALVHPAVEDFGIVAVEAMASGTPVIGPDMGGVAEVVRGAGGVEGAEGEAVPSQTGILFHNLTAGFLVETVTRFEEYSKTVGWDRKEIAKSAEKYDTLYFKMAMLDIVSATLRRFKENTLNDNIE
jgi:glycosyltransferase involved in cell wall biosynthesis